MSIVIASNIECRSFAVLDNRGAGTSENTYKIAAVAPGLLRYETDTDTWVYYKNDEETWVPLNVGGGGGDITMEDLPEQLLNEVSENTDHTIANSNNISELFYRLDVNTETDSELETQVTTNTANISATGVVVDKNARDLEILYGFVAQNRLLGDANKELIDSFTLGDCTDVDIIETPSEGNLLVYSSGKWTNKNELNHLIIPGAADISIPQTNDGTVYNYKNKEIQGLPPMENGEFHAYSASLDPTQWEDISIAKTDEFDKSVPQYSKNDNLQITYSTFTYKYLITSNPYDSGYNDWRFGITFQQILLTPQPPEEIPDGEAIQLTFTGVPGTLNNILLSTINFDNSLIFSSSKPFQGIAEFDCDVDISGKLTTNGGVTFNQDILGNASANFYRLVARTGGIYFLSNNDSSVSIRPNADQKSLLYLASLHTFDGPVTFDDKLTLGHLEIESFTNDILFSNPSFADAKKDFLAVNNDGSIYVNIGSNGKLVFNRNNATMGGYLNTNTNDFSTNGDLIVQGDITSGRAKMGNLFSNSSAFGDSNNFNDDSYAFVQTNLGETYINCAENTAIHFRIGNNGDVVRYSEDKAEFGRDIIANNINLREFGSITAHVGNFESAVTCSEINGPVGFTINTFPYPDETNYGIKVSNKDVEINGNLIVNASANLSGNQGSLYNRNRYFEQYTRVDDYDKNSDNNFKYIRTFWNSDLAETQGIEPVMKLYDTIVNKVRTNSGISTPGFMTGAEGVGAGVAMTATLGDYDAAWSHENCFLSNSYAISQTGDGRTYINCTENSSIYFRINNSGIGGFDNIGFISPSLTKFDCAFACQKLTVNGRVIADRIAFKLDNEPFSIPQAAEKLSNLNNYTDLLTEFPDAKITESDEDYISQKHVNRLLLSALKEEISARKTLQANFDILMNKFNALTEE